ncbi:MAG: HAMP domain-containing histidine kinase [Omnitrophica bacterium]|nr:HAMP domain-containing histidine kinase [Candidatus Omnitrophota bacterium]
MFRNNGPFKVVISIITLWSFLFNIFAYDIAWAAGTPSGPATVGSDRAGGPGTFKLPHHLGEVKQEGPPAGEPANRQTIIHIKDAHCDYACQHAIKGIIEYVNSEYGVDLALLEGGAGNYDLSVFTEIEDVALREKVADYFVKEGRINGAELFAIMNPEKITLKGLEDPEAYIANLNAYRESLKVKPKVEEILNDITKRLDEQKKRIYSEELTKLDWKKEDFANERLKLSGYVKYLLSLKGADKPGISYKNLTKLTHVLELEKIIDYRRANSERKRLINKLTKRLSKGEIETLVEKSALFKENKIKPSNFYAYLLDKMKVAGINPHEKYPNVSRYKEYLDKYDSIDKYLLFREIETLEDELFNTLATNDKQKKLYKEFKHLAILKDLFNLTITRDKYDFYRSLSELGLDKVFETLTPYLKLAERSYELAFERDLAFMRNIENRLTGSPANRQTIIIVTGGFHGDNLKKLITDKGYSYISIMPKFEGNREESPYFRLLNGGMLKEEKVILEAIAEISGLAILSMFSALKLDPDKLGIDVSKLAGQLRISCEKDGEFITTVGQGTEARAIRFWRENGEYRWEEIGEDPPVPGAVFPSPADAPTSGLSVPGVGIRGSLRDIGSRKLTLPRISPRKLWTAAATFLGAIFLPALTAGATEITGKLVPVAKQATTFAISGGGWSIAIGIAILVGVIYFSTKAIRSRVNANIGGKPSGDAGVSAREPSRKTIEVPIVDFYVPLFDKERAEKRNVLNNNLIVELTKAIDNATSDANIGIDIAQGIRDAIHNATDAVFMRIDRGEISPEDSHVRISFTVNGKMRTFFLKLSDTGIGINHEILKKWKSGKYPSTKKSYPSEQYSGWLGHGIPYLFNWTGLLGKKIWITVETKTKDQAAYRFTREPSGEMHIEENIEKKEVGTNIILKGLLYSDTTLNTLPSPILRFIQRVMPWWEIGFGIAYCVAYFHEWRHKFFDWISGGEAGEIKVIVVEDTKTGRRYVVGGKYIAKDRERGLKHPRFVAIMSPLIVSSPFLISGLIFIVTLIVKGFTGIDVDMPFMISGIVCGAASPLFAFEVQNFNPWNPESDIRVAFRGGTVKQTDRFTQQAEEAVQSALREVGIEPGEDEIETLGSAFWQTAREGKEFILEVKDGEGEHRARVTCKRTRGGEYEYDTSEFANLDHSLRPLDYTGGYGKFEAVELTLTPTAEMAMPPAEFCTEPEPGIDDNMPHINTDTYRQFVEEVFGSEDEAYRFVQEPAELLPETDYTATDLSTVSFEELCSHIEDEYLDCKIWPDKQLFSPTMRDTLELTHEESRQGETFLLIRKAKDNAGKENLYLCLYEQRLLKNGFLGTSELFFVNGQQIAHGLSFTREGFISIKMGRETSEYARALGEQGNMRKLLEMKLAFLAKKFDPIAFIVPKYMLGGVRELFIYVTNGHFLPFHSKRRQAIIERFLRTFKDDRSYRVTEQSDIEAIFGVDTESFANTRDCDLIAFRKDPRRFAITSLRPLTRGAMNAMQDVPLWEANRAHRKTPEAGIVERIPDEPDGPISILTSWLEQIGGNVAERLEEELKDLLETNVATSPDGEEIALVDYDENWKPIYSRCNVVNWPTFRHSHAGGCGINVSLVEVKRIMEARGLDYGKNVAERNKVIAELVFHELISACVRGNGERVHELATAVAKAVSEERYDEAARLLTKQISTDSKAPTLSIVNSWDEAVEIAEYAPIQNYKKRIKEWFLGGHRFYSMGRVVFSRVLADQQIGTNPASHPGRWTNAMAAIRYSTKYSTSGIPAILLEITKETVEKYNLDLGEAVPLNEVHRAWLVMIPTDEKFAGDRVRLAPVIIPGMSTLALGAPFWRITRADRMRLEREARRDFASSDSTAYEHPLGPEGASWQIQPTRASVLQTLNRLIDWLIDNNIGERDLLEAYRTCLKYSDPSLSPGLTMGKDYTVKSPYTGLPQVFLDIPRIYEEIRHAMTNRHDLAVYAMSICREAKGLIAADEPSQLSKDSDATLNDNVDLLESCIRNILLKEPDHRGRRKLAVAHLLDTLDKPEHQKLTEFLRENREAIIHNVAENMAPEYLECTDQVKALIESAKAGIYDPKQTSLARDSYKFFVESGGDPRTIFTIDFRDIGTIYFDAWLNGAQVMKDIVPASVHIFFMLSQVLSYKESNGKEGLDPNYAKLRLQRKAPPLAMLETSASVIFELVLENAQRLDRRAGEIRHNETFGSELTPTSGSLLEQLNTLGPNLTLKELDYILTNVFHADRVHPMYYLDLEKQADHLTITTWLTLLRTSYPILAQEQIRLIVLYLRGKHIQEMEMQARDAGHDPTGGGAEFGKGSGGTAPFFWDRMIREALEEFPELVTEGSPELVLEYLTDKGNKKRFRGTFDTIADVEGMLDYLQMFLDDYQREMQDDSTPKPLPNLAGLARSYRIWRQFQEAGDINAKKQRRLGMDTFTLGDTESLISRINTEYYRLDEDTHVLKQVNPVKQYSGNPRALDCKRLMSQNSTIAIYIDFLFVIEGTDVKLRVMRKTKKGHARCDREETAALLSFILEDSSTIESCLALIDELEHGIPLEEILYSGQEFVARDRRGGGLSGQTPPGEDTAEEGLGPTEQGIMPHRGGEETVNAELVNTLWECIPDLITEGRLNEEDVRAFELWLTVPTLKPGEDVPRDMQIAFEKLADPDIAIEAFDGKALRVVKLPVKELGRVNGEPFYGHVNYREGIIWVATEGVDNIEVKLRIMHEEQEYNLAAAVAAENLDISMAKLVWLRDNPVEASKELGYLPFQVQILFEMLHARAWRIVAGKCRNELGQGSLAGTIPDMKAELEKVRRATAYAKEAMAHLDRKKQELGELSPELAEFGIAPIASEEKPEEAENTAALEPTQETLTTPLEVVSQYDTDEGTATALLEAEEILGIRHDLGNILGVIKNDTALYSRSPDTEKATIELSNQVGDACMAVGDSGRAIKEYASGDRKGNLNGMIDPFKESSKRLIGLLTPANIKRLRVEFEKTVKNFSEKAARFFENRCIAAELILNSLLDPHERQPVNIRELLNIASCIELEERGTSFRINDVPKTPNPTGNEGQIYRVFTNLLRNAREHGKATEVTAEIAVIENTCTIRISDNGEGMPQDKVEAFNRGGRVSSEKEGGGRGLEQTRDLVHRNNGTIQAYAEPGKGTTFTITFPIGGELEQGTGTLVVESAASEHVVAQADTIVADEIPLGPHRDPVFMISNIYDALDRLYYPQFPNEIMGDLSYIFTNLHRLEEFLYTDEDAEEYDFDDFCLKLACLIKLNAWHRYTVFLENEFGEDADRTPRDNLSSFFIQYLRADRITPDRYIDFTHKVTASTDVQVTSTKVRQIVEEETGESDEKLALKAITSLLSGKFEYHMPPPQELSLIKKVLGLTDIDYGTLLGNRVRAKPYAETSISSWLNAGALIPEKVVLAARQVVLEKFPDRLKTIHDEYTQYYSEPGTPLDFGKELDPDSPILPEDVTQMENSIRVIPYRIMVNAIALEIRMGGLRLAAQRESIGLSRKVFGEAISLTPQLNPLRDTVTAHTIRMMESGVKEINATRKSSIGRVIAGYKACAGITTEYGVFFNVPEDCVIWWHGTAYMLAPEFAGKAVSREPFDGDNELSGYRLFHDGQEILHYNAGKNKLTRTAEMHTVSEGKITLRNGSRFDIGRPDLEGADVLVKSRSGRPIILGSTLNVIYAKDVIFVKKPAQKNSPAGGRINEKTDHSSKSPSPPSSPVQYEPQYTISAILAERPDIPIDALIEETRDRLEIANDTEDYELLESVAQGYWLEEAKNDPPQPLESQGDTKEGDVPSFDTPRPMQIPQGEMVWKAIPRGDVKKVLYPASGLDMATINSLISNIDTIEELHLVDYAARPEVVIKYLEILIRGSLKQDFLPADEVKQPEWGESWQIKMRNKNTGREITLYFHYCDYLNPEYLKALEGQIDLIVVKLPGYAGALSHELDNKDRFYARVFSHIRNGGYIYIDRARPPDSEKFLERLEFPPVATNGVPQDITKENLRQGILPRHEISLLAAPAKSAILQGGTYILFQTKETGPGTEGGMITPDDTERILESAPGDEASQSKPARGSEAASKERGKFKLLIIELLRKIAPDEIIDVEILSETLNRDRERLFKALRDWKKAFLHIKSFANTPLSHMCKPASEVFCEAFREVFPSISASILKKPYESSTMWTEHFVGLVHDKIVVDLTYSQFSGKNKILVTAYKSAQVKKVKYPNIGAGLRGEMDTKFYAIPEERLETGKLDRRKARLKTAGTKASLRDLEESIPELYELIAAGLTGKPDALGVVLRVKPDELSDGIQAANVLRSRARLLLGENVFVCVDDGSLSPDNLDRLEAFQADLAKAGARERTIAFTILDRDVDKATPEELERYGRFFTAMQDTARLVGLKGNHTLLWQQVFMGDFCADFVDAVNEGAREDIEKAIQRIAKAGSIMTARPAASYVNRELEKNLRLVAEGKLSLDEVFDGRKLRLELPDIQKAGVNTTFKERWKAEHAAARAL